MSLFVKYIVTNEFENDISYFLIFTVFFLSGTFQSFYCVKHEDVLHSDIFLFSKPLKTSPGTCIIKLITGVVNFVM
jgi:hypothetical protein